MKWSKAAAFCAAVGVGYAIVRGIWMISPLVKSSLWLANDVVGIQVSKPSENRLKYVGLQ